MKEGVDFGKPYIPLNCSCFTPERAVFFPYVVS
nr:MAG TPA: hypothetical protein [Bacteriophage sp.]